jgi:hypothetical protein
LQGSRLKLTHHSSRRSPGMSNTCKITTSQSLQEYE